MRPPGDAARRYPDARSAKINATTERKTASGRSRTWMLCMAALLSVYLLDGELLRTLPA